MIKINNKELDKCFTFPGGEVQIRLPDLGSVEAYVVDTLITSSDQLIQLFLTVDAIYHENTNKVPVTINLGYLPYARQDRVCFKGEAFSLDVMFSLLSTMKGVTSIIVQDYHSSIVPLPSFITNISMVDLLKGKDFTNVDLLISPDKGAYGKVATLSKIVGIPAIFLTKCRSPDTGYITYDGADTPDIASIYGKSVLILDDICDGGMTFILLAKLLSEYGPSSISLHVTHGIFSKGTQVLLDAGIQRITCINSWAPEIKDIK